MEELNCYEENIARYFDGGMSTKQIEKMEKDILNDNNKRNELKDFSKIWEKSGELGNYDKINLEEDWQKVRSRMGFLPKTRKIPFRSYFIRIAAIIVLAFGLAYFFTQLIHNVPQDTVSDYYTVTSENQSKEVILPDNSVIVLNKNSKLVYNSNFGSVNRDIILEGEAFFNVQRNESLPFRVFTDNSTVEVLGTSFNIKQKDNKIKVSVLTGNVAFYETDKKDNRVGLTKNESSEFNLKTKHFSSKKELSPNTLAWKTGKFKVVQGQPVEEFFQAVADYYHLKLEMKVENNFNENFEGTDDAEFTAESIDSVMEYADIVISRPFAHDVQNGKLIIRDK